MEQILLQSIEKNSLMWILLSSIIGGGIGAMIKLSLGVIVPEKYKDNSHAKKQFKKNKIPLLKSVDSLDRRIKNFTSNYKKGWYDNEESNYYRISTLYLFGVYLGWCKIIEDSEILSIGYPDKKMKMFIHTFYKMYKALTGFYYFKNSPKITNVEDSAVPRFALTAIGELMINTDHENNNNSIISFIQFSKLIENNSDFIKWFGYLEKSILTDQKDDIFDARWNRILIINSMLSVFVTFLDPNSTFTTKRKDILYEKMDSEVKSLLDKDIKEIKSYIK